MGTPGRPRPRSFRSPQPATAAQRRQCSLALRVPPSTTGYLPAGCRSPTCRELCRIRHGTPSRVAAANATQRKAKAAACHHRVRTIVSQHTQLGTAALVGCGTRAGRSIAAYAPLSTGSARLPRVAAGRLDAVQSYEGLRAGPDRVHRERVAAGALVAAMNRSAAAALRPLARGTSHLPIAIACAAVCVEVVEQGMTAPRLWAVLSDRGHRGGEDDAVLRCRLHPRADTARHVRLERLHVRVTRTGATSSAWAERIACGGAGCAGRSPEAFALAAASTSTSRRLGIPTRRMCLARGAACACSKPALRSKDATTCSLSLGKPSMRIMAAWSSTAVATQTSESIATALSPCLVTLALSTICAVVVLCSTMSKYVTVLYYSAFSKRVYTHFRS